MNLRDLEYVLAVVQNRNFSIAAERCNVSQPALSNQIKKLELELGIDLFLRLPGEVRPTVGGARIAEIASLVQLNVQKIKDLATEYRDPEALPLRVGVTPALAPYLTRYLSDLFGATFPNMRVIMVEDLPDSMLKKVANYELDTALLAQANRSNALDFTPVWKERLMLAMRRGHPLENRPQIFVEDVPADDLIRLPYSFGYDLEARLPVSDNAEKSNKAFDLSAARFDTVCRHLRYSDSVTIVSSVAAEFMQVEDWGMSFVPFAGPGNTRCIGAVSRPNCPRFSILKKMYDYISQQPPGGASPV
ncbi:LysR family transcriptional regulator [Pseudooctadecabacter jejudonensis]|uniref:Hydrogen peroxide-inducible genes activator n=1 Tax=Pseudooctadecabacter jejudonensis TaxID=1391910 RepID=A0A1Y5T5X8_9RHOB|nr:LysR family transcriptional regulator [Pseudooctadecabacter jejudonensis]SLN56656.1 Hydrogen peroxide-inducible genes activator [Pseudooctadecabacter jejudonensis]